MNITIAAGVFDGGDHILKWHVRVHSSNQTTIDKTVTMDYTESITVIQIDNLINGNNYYFDAAAQNVMGNSLWSAIVGPIIPSS